MTTRLNCPECGNVTFMQERSVLYDEFRRVEFNMEGVVEDEDDFADEPVFLGVQFWGAYRCEECGWELVNDEGKPIVGSVEIARSLKQRESQP